MGGIENDRFGFSCNRLGQSLEIDIPIIFSATSKWVRSTKYIEFCGLSRIIKYFFARGKWNSNWSRFCSSYCFAVDLIGRIEDDGFVALGKQGIDGGVESLPGTRSHQDITVGTQLMVQPLGIDRRNSVVKRNGRFGVPIHSRPFRTVSYVFFCG